MKHWKQHLGYGLIAAAVMLGLWSLTNPLKLRQLEKSPATVIMMGDSVWGECRDESSVPSLVASLTGLDVRNCAFGGTTLSRLPSSKGMYLQKECLSMESLSAAIRTGDFGIQQSLVCRESMTEYFADTVDELEQVDFTKADIVLIEHGINDYHAGVDIEDFIHSLQTIISNLRKVNPSLRIVLVTPVYTWYTEGYYGEFLTGETYVTGDFFLNDYVEAEIAFAREENVEIIDVYHDTYPTESFDDWKKVTNDGLHPNEVGRRILAEKIAAYLE